MPEQPQNGTKVRLEQAERIDHDHEVRIRLLERTLTDHAAWAREANKEQVRFNERLVLLSDRNSCDHEALSKELSALRVAVGKVSVRVGMIVAGASIAVTVLMQVLS